MVTERTVDLRPDRGVRVRGEDALQVRPLVDDLPNRIEDAVERCAPVLPPVCGHEHQPGIARGDAGVDGGEPRIRQWYAPRGDRLRGVDHRVPRQHDALAQDSLRDQCLDRAGGRGQMQVRDHADEPAVGLLGKGGGEVTRAEPSLEVHQRDAPPERDEAPDQHRGGVALDDHRRRPLRDEDPVERRGELGDELGLVTTAPVEVEEHIRT